MKKILLVSGLLAGGALALLSSSSPASAALGCACVKLGESPMCVGSIEQCVSGIGGLCLAPCDYKPVTMMMHEDEMAPEGKMANERKMTREEKMMREERRKMQKGM
jgi:hypothetical protein